MWRLAVALCFAFAVEADVYLNHPRGSNNKLTEAQNNAKNQNRLFDSQNNANGGHQVGDDCKPHCQTDNTNTAYKDDKPGARQGIMSFYVGSELYIEWLAQHGCGVGHPNLHCNMVLQYMCDTDNPKLFDGNTTNPPTNNGQLTADDLDADKEGKYGQHESEAYYKDCSTRDRNKGLYIADQDLAGPTRQSARSTRQNNQGTRRGRECPEERDHYPYWHPTPWHDIAILTDEPQIRCEYYRRESQNVVGKGTCIETYKDSTDNVTKTRTSKFNNPVDCSSASMEWKLVGKHDEPPPECVGGIQSRDNHNGNARNGQPMYYTWNIPEHILKDGAQEAKCVLRMRYNITTGDFSKLAAHNQPSHGWNGRKVPEDWFTVDSAFNGLVTPTGTANRRRFSTAPGPILPDNPIGDILGFSRSKDPTDTKDYYLQLQVNTNQYGRTFQDRTHVFKVKPRPDSVSSSARIVNFNVRGRRGNINEVYPSVEYDFVPTELTVDKGTYLHFQWTGSDNNNRNNAGNGRAGTDRSNLVQISHRGGTTPMALKDHTLLVDMTQFSEGDASKAFKDATALVKKFAYLDQETCKKGDDLANDNDEENCMQLNGASAYFDGGLVQMNHIGEHHIISTRNNDFSNRSHKATITVIMASLGMAATAAFAFSGVVVLIVVGYLAVACYALRRPGSWLFSKRYRPRVLNFLSKEKITAREAERREILRAEREHLKRSAEIEMTGTSSGAQPLAALPPRAAEAPAARKDSCFRKLFCCCCGDDGDMGTAIFVMMNIIVFNIGFWTNWGGGFKGNIAYPFAKGAGYALDLDYALLILPTLKSLQTSLRGRSGSSNLTLMDDPISFHILVATLIFFFAAIHIAAHVVHMQAIAKEHAIQDFKLGNMALSDEEAAAGTSIVGQLLAPPRLVGLTGILITLIMMFVGMTSINCVRRGTNTLTKILGGYKVFTFFHSTWYLTYILLLVHAPSRLWIWFFFPLLFVLIDKVLQNQHSISYAVLKNVHLMPYDVLNLNFESPDGFSYQPGQYVLLGWRGEWHPFTLTSAPEERQLSVHIRSPDALDWCSALRRHVAYELPAAAGLDPKFPPVAGPPIKYMKCLDLASGRVYSRPETSTSKRLMGDDEEDGNSGSFSQGEIPADAVALQLQGPFGAPAQRCWEYETIMVVGSGIGVTPFISIVRSVQERVRLRQLMGDNSMGKKREKRHKAHDHGDMKSREEIAADIVPVPYKIYFVWIVPNTNTAMWFSDVLLKAMTGPTKDIVDISIYITGEQEVDTTTRLECADRQFCGRPNWARVFKEVKKAHQYDHIGVFLCGSPEIGKQLSAQSIAFSDPPGIGACKFSFHKENF